MNDEYAPEGAVYPPLKEVLTRSGAGLSQRGSGLVGGRIPPQALEMEQAVLGALMLEKDALSKIIDVLRPEMFYRDAHREVFESVFSLFQNSEPIDILTVKNHLAGRGKLDVAGGAYYLSELTSKVASAANIEYHARVIAQKFLMRELIKIGDQVVAQAYDETTDVFDLLDSTEQNLFSLSETNLRRNYMPMSDLVVTTLHRLEELRGKEGGVTGVPSGFTMLDAYTSGWQRSDLIICAARPAMGKCLGKGTLVLMYDGSLRKVEDVKQGDLLMGDDSTPRKVLSIARGRERMYWVHQNKAMSYRVNESHILSLKRSRNEGSHRHGDVLNITVKDWLEKSPKFRTNYKGYKVGVQFPEQALPLEPHFLGLWLGDGRSDDSRIAAADPEVVSALASYAERLGMKLHRYEQKERVDMYAITDGYGSDKSASLKVALRNLGVLENKHIPQQYLINSEANRLALLAGLIDSDGHYLSEVCGYEITQKNERLARQIKFLCDTLGFKTSLRKKKAQIKSIGFEGEVWRVRIFGDIERVPVKVQRKKARAWQSKADWRMTGINVEFDQVDDYYGFEIDGNRLFLLEDMTVTHNTAFTLTVARNAAVRFNIPVAFFSLEMAATQLVQRLLCAEAEIDAQKVRTGRLENYEWEQLNNRIGSLSKAPLFIDDTPALSIMDLRAKARRLKAEKNIGMIIIDYLQLMTGTVSKGGNREQEIAGISRSLKELAKEIDVPIIALSQLSRAVETRGGDKKPMLSDLRESGSIEQDADMVMFLYRPEYYGLTTYEDGTSTQGVAEVIIAKQRNGPVGDVKLQFINKFAKFGDLQDSSGYSQLAGMGIDTTTQYGGGGGGGGGSIIRPSKMNNEDDEESGRFQMPRNNDVPF